MWDLIVIITAWNVRELLANCLESVFRHPIRARTKVVVLDDASSDGTCDALREKFPQAEWLRSDENLGFIRANNHVLRIYWNQARYFLLLNADTIVQPGAFDALVEFLNSHPEAGIAGGKVTRPDGTLDWPCKRSYITPTALLSKALGLDQLFPRSRLFGQYELTYLDENQLHEVDAVLGAFLAIRRETLHQIGPMDERFFMYGDDLDWSYKAKAAGWKVYYVPQAHVIHYKSASNIKRSYHMIYWLYYSTWLVYKRHLARRYSFPVNALVWLGFQVMCGASLARNFFRREKGLPFSAV